MKRRNEAENFIETGNESFKEAMKHREQQRNIFQIIINKKTLSKTITDK